MIEGNPPIYEVYQDVNMDIYASPDARIIPPTYVDIIVNLLVACYEQWGMEPEILIERAKKQYPFRWGA